MIFIVNRPNDLFINIFNSKMDKLALIKQKYGYVPNAEAKYISKPAVDK
jgi:hypothetical protein